MSSHRFETTSHDPAETRRWGMELGARARPGDVFLLMGDLGSGKTCFTQGILWGLGGDEYARSPTFVLVAEYRARFPLYHIDLYRLNGPHDASELGLEEYVGGDGLCVVEWADRAPDLFPDDRLEVRIDRLGETTRQLTILAVGGGYRHVMEALPASLERGVQGAKLRCREHEGIR